MELFSISLFERTKSQDILVLRKIGITMLQNSLKMQLINDHELHFGKGVVGVYLIRIMHLKKLEKFLDSLKNEDFSHSTHGICIFCQ